MRKVVLCLLLIFICCFGGCIAQPATTNAVTPTMQTPTAGLTSPTDIPSTTPEPTSPVEVTATPTTIEIFIPTDVPTNAPVPTVEIVAPTETPLPTMTPTNTPTPIPTPTVTPKPSKTEVPNVVGLTFNNASDILTNLGFNVGFDFVYNNNEKKNVILSQDLKEGTIVEIGTMIWLECSLGPEPTPTPSPKPSATPIPSATPTPRPTATPKPSATPYPLPPEEEIIHHEEEPDGNTITTYNDGTIVKTYPNYGGNTVIIYPNNTKVNIQDGEITFYKLDENGKSLYKEHIEEYQVKEEFLIDNGIKPEDFDKYKIYFVMHYHDKVNGDYRYIANSDGSKNKWSDYKIPWDAVIGIIPDVRIYDINGETIHIPLEDFPLYEH